MAKIDDLCGTTSTEALPRPAMIRTWHTLLTSSDWQPGMIVGVSLRLLPSFGTTGR